MHEFPPLRARRIGGPRRLRRLLASVAIVVAVVAASSAVAIYVTNDTEPPVGSDRNPITLLLPWEGEEEAAFLKVLKAFEKQTGLKAQVEEAPTFLPVLRARIEAGNSPMVAMIPTSGMLADLAREGVLVPLDDLGISDSYLSQTFSSTWVDYGRVDGEVYAFPAKAGSKSVFWYRPDDLEALGLDVPKTWAQLVSVTKGIRAAGETPWALSAQDSWTLTDWFENIYIRTAGPAKYGELFAGELRFDHPSVIAALTRMTTLLAGQNIAGGVSGALETDLGEGIIIVFGASPDAHLYMEGGFVGSLALQFIEPKPKPGRTINVAPFPAIDPNLGSPLIGGSSLAAAFVDNAAVTQLLLYLSSPEAGKAWVSTGYAISPSKRVPQSAYPNVLVRAEARQLIGATVVVSDGSDLLPGSLGVEFGSTLQDAIQRPGDIPELMEDFQRKAAREFK